MNGTGVNEGEAVVFLIWDFRSNFLEDMDLEGLGVMVLNFYILGPSEGTLGYLAGVGRGTLLTTINGHGSFFLLT